MKIHLRPLYSQLNPGVGNCPLGCDRACRVVESQTSASVLQPRHGQTCPLFWHQAQTYAQLLCDQVDIIFNKSATGGGKSLAAYLLGLLNPQFRMVALYPTIELIADQENQIKTNYLRWFTSAHNKRIDSLYGKELAKRVEQAQKGNKFKELLRSLKRSHFILTNPDIFHLILHFRYYNPATEPGLLPYALAQYPHLYLCDEFHIFREHQETAILNSLILIRQTRQRNSPLKVLFTSATPKPNFITQLKQAGFRVQELSGHYRSENCQGYCQIAQPVELEFVELKDTDALKWLTEQIQVIKSLLQGETRGRGLIILNSVALVNQVVRQLQNLFGDEVVVKEISGRVDQPEREITRQELEHSEQPVLIVATSAVDVGVDFDIHLLIFEASDSATFIQRLGRLGRHKGFTYYKAFALIPGWMRWIVPQLQNILVSGETVDRTQFREEIIEQVFNPPQEYEQYRRYWGALQAQGMLFSISGAKIANKRERGERLAVTQAWRDRIIQDLRQVYGEQLDKKRGHWCGLGKDKTGQAIQEELLRFRGSSDLQAAVWEPEYSRFYTYDLLLLLPYAAVEVMKRQAFLEEAAKRDRAETEFPERYIQVYLKIQSWSDQRYDIELDCEWGTDELTLCTLTRIDGVSIEGHPQRSPLNQQISRQKLLAFLVPLSRQHPTIWDVRNRLYLSPNFGLYQLTDADDESYACAFNQDALLLEALKWKLKRCQRTKPYIFG
ncbi:type I-D CRISPR-associated helicase Cas3' [Coleofasciculus sp.]|uniref:type I-D CRISPR-associated helicase Cas3' n=1 Tax=Coleofasciculus sp. TaxID=3100458 RepID=UPI003A409EDB